MSACRATGCDRPIPEGQVFCRRCLNVMSKETQHRLLSDRSPAAIGTAQAELNRLRGHVAPRSTPSIAPSPAKSSFRKAREHTASALEILERNKK